MFVSHAKVRIVGLGGRSKKRRPHRRRLGLREMAGMPCLIPTALTVLLGLLAVAFGAGMALLGYLPTMDALVEVGNNMSASKLSSSTHTPSTIRRVVDSHSSPVDNAGTSGNQSLKNSIVFTSSAISSPNSTSSESSSSLHTNGPKYSQLAESVAPTNGPRGPEHSHGHRHQHHKHQDANTSSSSIPPAATASVTPTAASGEDSLAPQVVKTQTYTGRFLALRACSYAGPVVMAIGMFAMIMACVFYCEVLDKYAILVPDKGHGPDLQKDELYQIIIEEMKKSYAQTLITAYTKAAERSLLVHEHPGNTTLGAGTGVTCSAPPANEDQTQHQQQQQQQQHLADPLLPYHPLEPLSLEQQIDIECEGYTPSPPVPNKRYSVIQARIQRLRSEDNWLKTSSLPNIRRSMSIKRAGRVGAKVAENSRTLSYDYTMDEARLRRKSMMLRSIVQWNSGSSGDLLTQQAQAARAMHQRRFSSAKALQSQPDDSLDELFQEQSHGSFPLTRLIQRRGTFACGDMRTRRMKFLILLQASESNEVFQQQQQQRHRRQSTFPHSKHHQHNNASIDSRSASRFAGIRRNSFIPYNTCDKFISTEEKRSARSSRRPSVNPFAPRLAQQYAEPERGTIRRHSFFPIRREDKIYESDPLEQRRHSFNPIGVNNTLKPECTGGSGDRRGSYNPESRRGSYVPPLSGQQKSSRFLQVPGFEHEFHMERRPSEGSSGSETGGSPHLLFPPPHHIDPSPYSGPARQPGKQLYCGLTSNVPEQQPDRGSVERRHSFNPMVRVSAASIDNDSSPVTRGAPNVPIIVLNADTSGRFLTVPSQDGERGQASGGAAAPNNCQEMRRHSFNTTQSACLPPTNSRFALEKSVPHKNISFKLEPCTHTNSSALSTPTSQASSASMSPSHPLSPLAKRSSLKHKPPDYSPSDSASPTAVRPSSFNQDMVLFQPLPTSDSRGVSPSSNLSFCGSERIGSERSPKASRTASISSDYSAVTTSALVDDTFQQVAAPDATRGAFRPVSPAGYPASRHFAPARSHSRQPDPRQYDVLESNPYQHDLEGSGRSRFLHSGEVRRCASFRESRRSRLFHQGRMDSDGSVESGPATLSPSLITNANAAIQRSRSANSLPGERASVARREGGGDSNPLRVFSNRWEDVRYTPQEARRLAEDRYAFRSSSPQSPSQRTFGYASSRVPKPPSPLVGKHWPPARHDTDSNSS